MTSFIQTLNPTPFAFFDSDPAFQVEADAVVTWVKRKLGDDIISVELTKKQIWACLEEAMLEYSSLINQYQAKSQLNNFLGGLTGSLSGSEQRYPEESLEYLVKFAQPYAMEAGIGGYMDSISGSITLEPGRQDYNIYTELKDANGNVIFNSPDNVGGGRMHIREVFHFSPSAAYRFFDTSSAINYLNNEFSFESFTPETIFYVLPVFEDILRAGQLDLSQRVRRSNYYYKIMGKNFRIYPTPSLNSRTHLFLRIQFQNVNPLSSSIGNTTSSYGVSNLSNIPFGNIPYSSINSIGRQWVRQYALGLAKELLGLVRSKFESIPIPEAELRLNGSTLVTQGREDQDKLKTTLKDMLESMTYDKILETQATKAESMMKLLKMIPVPNGGAIFTG